MIRSELIQLVHDELLSNKRHDTGKRPTLMDAERIVDTIFNEIVAAMARGDRVELRGFGAFSVKRRNARTGRNPRTGATVDVEEKHVPFFKAGKLVRDRLNGQGS